MNDLGTVLRQAGDAVGPLRPVDPADLWQQGRQRVRRRRALGAGVVAAVVAVVAGFVVTGPSLLRTEAGPVATTHAPALPRNVYDPPAWLPSTTDEGPLGQLAVLGVLPDGDDLAPFGISATTGEYRRLDLPGRAPQTSLALSPDGTRVAYWLTGRTRKASFPKDEINEGGPVKDPVVGYAVYDTDTGQVVRREVPTDYGLATDGDWALLWLDADTLALHYGIWAGSNTWRAAASYVWKPGPVTGEPVKVGGDGQPDHLVRGPDGTLLGWADTDRAGEVRVYDTDLRPVGTSFIRPEMQIVPDLSRYGDGLVVMTGSIGPVGYSHLLAGPVVEGGQPRLTRIGDLYVGKLLGWLSAHEVLVSAWHDEPNGRPSLFRADLSSGQVTRLGAAADDYDAIVAFTQDLLERPLVEGLRPDFGPDPRLVRLGAGGAVVLVGLVALLLRRRRARH